MSHLTNDDHYGYVMSLIASVAVLQFQFVEDMTQTDIKAASDYLQEFPLLPGLDFRGQKVETPFIVPVDPTIIHGAKSLDSITIDDPKARMVREANKVLVGDATLEKIQKRNFRLVQLISNADEILLKRVPVSTFRKAEEAALSFL
jgi:hypothetical protein